MGLWGSLFGSSRMNRNEYNAKVSQIIVEDYGVTPDSRVEPRFPGVMAYLEQIDYAYHENASPEQAALRIMVMLFSGYKKSQSEKDSLDGDVLFGRIRANMRQYLADGVIHKEMYDTYAKAIKKHTGCII